MEEKKVKSYDSLELARNLALVYGLNFSYNFFVGVLERYPVMSLQDFRELSMHVTTLMKYVLIDLHDFALDYACHEIGPKKYFTLESQLMFQFDKLRNLL